MEANSDASQATCGRIQTMLMIIIGVVV